MKLPTKFQWRQFFKILNKKEKIIFSLFLFVFAVSFLFLLINFYFENTEIQPAQGGIFIEGVVGRPRFINPIFAPTNDVDRDLTEFIFSGLMKYNSKGEIVPDLTENYEILENGKVWEISLKENLAWSDSQPLTSDDAVFTFETIQNADTKSPLRSNWVGVKVEKISDFKIRLTLKNPYSSFLENLTLKIIPKHIWGNTPPQDFPLSFSNLQPVGSGPYKLKNLMQDKEGKIVSLILGRNPYYYGATPNIQEISFHFFDNENDLIKSCQRGEIKGCTPGSSKNLSLSGFNLYSLSLPRYFAVFLNPSPPNGGSKILADEIVRQALNYGTNKEEIVAQVLEERGEIVDSPILPEIYGFKAPSKIYNFDLEKAKTLLEQAGFKETERGIREKIVKKELAFQFKSNLKTGSQGKEVEELQKCLAKDKEIYPEGEVTGYFGSSTKAAVIKFQEKYKDEILKPNDLEKGTGEVLKSSRTKLNEVCFEKPEEKIPLKFTLATVDQPSLTKVASILKEQWRALGVDVEVKTYDILTLEKEIIKPRGYDALLFGEVLGRIPDPFPFWHSSQKKDPGLNLALYENKDCDKLLEEGRQTLDEGKREELLEKFQDLLIKDAPAVFLYNPSYSYFVSKEIKGIIISIIANPSKRFADIEEWYVKTKRVWR